MLSVTDKIIENTDKILTKYYDLLQYNNIFSKHIHTLLLIYSNWFLTPDYVLIITCELSL